MLSAFAATVVGASSAHAESAPSRQSLFNGFFFDFGLGYAGEAGEDGPAIPNVVGTVKVGNVTTKTTISLQGLGGYDQLVTSRVGDGLGLLLKIGYNIEGYVSLWFDIDGHGNPSSNKAKLSGGGTVAFMAGVHPMRFVRPKSPVDFQLYAGYAPFAILAYNEPISEPGNQTGKSWTGSAVPFGLHTRWKPNADSVFVAGLDLRAVYASYDTWWWNWNREEKATLSEPVTTLRFIPRVTVGVQF
jgi:hypothetical protein